MTGFQLPALPALSRATALRDEALRKDEGKLDESWATGQVVLVDELGRTPVRDGASKLSPRPALSVAPSRPADARLLGVVHETAYWSVLGEEPMRAGTVAPPNSWGPWTGQVSEAGEQWHDLRAIGALLDDTEAGLFTTAVGLANWHARSRFCAKCGSPVAPVAAGWAMHCTGCGREEYPRTDPAVICLVHDGVGENGENVLLARQPIWPEGRFSVLAGFVETGESLEACVEREIGEEVGVLVSDIRYLGSQPWPFPRSIMIGFVATADPSAPLVPADGEIEQARWVPRSVVRAALEAGGAVDGLVLPGATSIARQMISGWAEAGA
ncbi:NAD(+) diphosphatase [Actinokineospora pegani]|uniref:NAD(+) diphosphatase n=1 Tax=Actinokineospora pegani TaxID=2654637 RepID=UPI0012EA2E8B|nr:NAD(+) diphosphatase [Actinokineospora pegani]